MSLLPEGLPGRVRVLPSLEEIEELAPAWNRLAQACGAPPVAAPAFLVPWYRHRARHDRTCAVAVTGRSGRLLAFLPLLITRQRRGHLPVTILQLATRNAWAPGPGPLLDPEVPADEMAELLAEVALSLPGWRIAEFFPLAPGSPFESALRHEVLRRRLHAVTSPPVESAEIVLAGAGTEDELLARFTRGRRQRVRRGYRLLAQGRLAAREARSPRDLGRALEDAFAIAERSWQGQQGTSIASSPESRAFYREACLRLARAGQLDLWLLLEGDHPIAFDLQAVVDGRAYRFHRGYLPERAPLGPGVILLGEILRHHLRRGVRSCELFQPATDDKRRWNPRTPTWHGLRIFSPRPAASLLGRIDELRHLLRRRGRGGNGSSRD